MTDAERKALVRELKCEAQCYPYDYAANQIEADGQRIAELEAEVQSLMDELAFNGIYPNPLGTCDYDVTPLGATTPSPKFPVGSWVYSHVFFDPDTPKHVVKVFWDGVDHRYTVANAQGERDEGYMERDFKEMFDD